MAEIMIRRVRTQPAPGLRERVFGELFRRHAPRLHAYIKRRLGPTLADDVVSDTFAIAFRRRERFDGRSEFSAWLWGVASKLITRHHRQAAKFDGSTA